jgi:hypothetical protein
MSAYSAPADQSPSVVKWRRHRLMDAGFDYELATELARDDTVDLHAVLALIDRGCPPDLAARICAPVSSGNRWSL